MIEIIRKSLKSKLNSDLVDQLLETYSEAKNNFYLGKLRIHEVEGGRFCEAVYRILEDVTTNKFTPLGRPLDTLAIADNLLGLPKAKFPDSIRLHIPRALRVVYDIRNTRDAAHLADGIDPNIQDASLVISTIDWILAELLRLYHIVSPQEAQRIVNAIVQKKPPVIQDFNGILKVLNTSLSASEYCLVLLYAKGADGSSLSDLQLSVLPKMRSNLKRTLEQLSDIKGYVHIDKSGTYFITRTGEIEAEKFLN